MVPITRVHQFPPLDIFGHPWAPVGTSGHHRAALGVVHDSPRRAPGGARRCPVVPGSAQWCPSLEYTSSHHWTSMGTGGHQWAPQGSTWRRARQSSTCARQCPAVPSGAQWCPVVPITRVYQFHHWAPVGTSGHQWAPVIDHSSILIRCNPRSTAAQNDVFST